MLSLRVRWTGNGKLIYDTHVAVFCTVRHA